MKKFSKYLPVLPLILGGITLSFVLAISVWSVTGNKPLFQTQSRAGNEEVSLSLSPSSGVWKVGETQSVGIILSGGGKIITGVDLTLNYDTGLASIDSANIKNGSLLERVLLNNVKSGKISYSAVTNNPSSKNGILATLTFMPLKKGNLEIKFGLPNDIMEAGSAVNILNKTVDGRFDIQ